MTSTVQAWGYPVLTALQPTWWAEHGPHCDGAAGLVVQTEPNVLIVECACGDRTTLDGVEADLWLAAATPDP